MVIGFWYLSFTFFSLFKIIRVLLFSNFLPLSFAIIVGQQRSCPLKHYPTLPSNLTLLVEVPYGHRLSPLEPTVMRVMMALRSGSGRRCPLKHYPTRPSNLTLLVGLP
jgi:hypothetical protein